MRALAHGCAPHRSSRRRRRAVLRRSRRRGNSPRPPEWRQPLSCCSWRAHAGSRRADPLRLSLSSSHCQTVCSTMGRASWQLQARPFALRVIVVRRDPGQCPAQIASAPRPRARKDVRAFDCCTRVCRCARAQLQVPTLAAVAGARSTLAHAIAARARAPRLTPTRRQWHAACAHNAMALWCHGAAVAANARFVRAVRVVRAARARCRCPPCPAPLTLPRRWRPRAPLPPAARDRAPRSAPPLRRSRPRAPLPRRSCAPLLRAPLLRRSRPRALWRWHYRRCSSCRRRSCCWRKVRNCPTHWFCCGVCVCVACAARV